MIENLDTYRNRSFTYAFIAIAVIVVAAVILVVWSQAARADCQCVCGSGPTPQRICTSSEGISDACWGTCPVIVYQPQQPTVCHIEPSPVTGIPMWRC